MRDAFASINVQLKKRWDLEAVEAFAGHERGVLEAVIAAGMPVRDLPNGFEGKKKWPLKYTNCSFSPKIFRSSD